MRAWPLVTAAVAAYAVALVGSAPATLVDAALRRVSDGRVRVAEARGTVWSGAGVIEILDATQRTAVAKYFAWHFFPASLLRGRLNCEIRLESGSERLAVTVFPARVELADADISVPATILGVIVPKLGPLRLGGDLRVRAVDLAIRSGAVHGNATLQWHAASSAHTQMSPLGDYELRLADSGTESTATLRTVSGALQLDGGGAWDNSARPEFRATARVLPQYRAQLEPFLRMIAVERGAGVFDLALQ